MNARRAFWIFAVFIVLTTLADRLMFIILPLWLITTGFSATEIGAIFSAAGLALAAFRLFAGKLSDLLGRKGLMCLGLAADSLATAFMPAARGISQFTALKATKDVSQNLASTMEDAMMGVKPTDLRKEEGERLTVLSKVNSILDAFDFGDFDGGAV